MEPIDTFIGRLPKVELHLHLVGSASVPTVLELRRGKYTEAARVVGNERFSAVRPFPVTIVPAELLR